MTILEVSKSETTKLKNQKIIKKNLKKKKSQNLIVFVNK